MAHIASFWITIRATHVLVRAGKLSCTGLTSIPACRKTLRAEKNKGYFDFKHLRFCEFVDTSYNLVYIVFQS